MELKNQNKLLLKKRKADGKEVKINSKVGTSTEHFLAYLTNVMNTLDKNNIKGQYIVMDNASIHKPKVIKALIEERGHKCIYLPPYSPFLNPIEEFWSKVKAGVRRTPLTADDRLTDHICESAGKVTKKDCKGWIEHSKSFFENCLKKTSLKW